MDTDKTTAITKRRHRISVILATYNGERFLTAQLDSIAAQTHPPDEILIGDDGSSDGTVKLIEAFSHPKVPIRLVRHPQRLGSTGNFARLMTMCSGDVIFFSDQDDIWHRDRITRSLEALEKFDADYVFSDASIIDDQSRLTGETLWAATFFTQRERAMVRDGRGFEVLLRHNVVTGATMAIRRRVLDWVLPIEGHWVHDGWIALIAEAMGRGTMIESPLISYRRHDSQQIGALGLSPRRLLRFLNGQSAEYLNFQAEDYRLAAGRLEHLAATASVPAHLTDRATALYAKADFLSYRSQRRQRSRLLRVVNTAMAKSYRRFGLGWRTLAVDVLAPRSPPR